MNKVTWAQNLECNEEKPKKKSQQTSVESLSSFQRESFDSVKTRWNSIVHLSSAFVSVFGDFLFVIDLLRG